jgi:uncharacterized protein
LKQERQTMKDIEVRIPCEDFTLEGKWYKPESNGPFPAAVVCHPHPLHGGNFRNNVVKAVYWDLAEHGFAVLRFNFRGVGGSGGAYGEGTAEIKDVQAAVSFALSRPGVDGGRLGIAGYSFGGGVSVRESAADVRVKALALISPQLGEEDWELLRKHAVPLLLVTGSRDQFFPLDQYEANLKTVPETKQFHIVKGADHMWIGYEAEMAVTVRRFLVDNIRIMF